MLLPFYGVAYGATVVSALAQVATTKLQPEFNAFCCEFGTCKEDPPAWLYIDTPAVFELVHHAQHLTASASPGSP